MKIGLAQINTTVGDLPGNFEKIIAAYRRAVSHGANLVLTPELAVTGYPPQDLLFKSRFVPANLEVVARLEAAVGDVPLVVGFADVQHPGRPGQFFRNAAALLQRGRPAQTVYKSLLPTYDVFDEPRYFEPATAAALAPIECNGCRLGITICEDIWCEPYLPRPFYSTDPARLLVERGADVILNLSASPFQCGKPRRRFEMISKLAAEYQRPFVYCNAVGGNDELIFDGNSCVFDAQGGVLGLLPRFEEDVAVIDLAGAAGPLPPLTEEPAELYPALVLGLRDYFAKCGFKSAVLGLSGGIDSAVTACLAVAALGAANVTGVAMPGPYSSKGSVADAHALAENLGIRCLQVPITESFEVFRRQFAEIFAGLPEDSTEENMQARLRGMVLMSLSNKFGSLLLTTGNKSELAVGYCTLYGDMAGGLAVISDVPKTSVYRLANFINREREWIPRSSVEKPPSAELKPNQVDRDSLPPYEVLDSILALYVEENLSAMQIIARGYDAGVVRWIQRRVDLNEYKRAQAAPGLRVTSKAFGSGRRMPIAQRFVE
jgi:NAD+ synthase (glutamine-hydrolysing)